MKEKIFKKISEILKPYVQRVLSGMVEDFAPTGTRSVINTCATLLVSRKLDGVIEESSKKIRTWLDTNNQDILDELNRIISQIIAVE